MYRDRFHLIRGRPRKKKITRSQWTSSKCQLPTPEGKFPTAPPGLTEHISDSGLEFKFCARLSFLKAFIYHGPTTAASAEATQYGGCEHGGCVVFDWITSSQERAEFQTERFHSSKYLLPNSDQRRFQIRLKRCWSQHLHLESGGDENEEKQGKQSCSNYKDTLELPNYSSILLVHVHVLCVQKLYCSSRTNTSYNQHLTFMHLCWILASSQLMRRSKNI